MPEEVDFEVTGVPVEEDLYFNKLESEAYDIWALTPAGIKAAEESELEEAAAEAAADAAQDALEEAIEAAGYW
jgi:hypothetical protein